MSLRQKVDSFRGDCFVITNDGEKIPLRVESIDFDPNCVGPEIHGYLLEHIRVKENDSPIKKVIFNNPATVVIWEDGTKTVVKCQEGDTYSEELGLAMCIAKKFFGNKSNFNEVFKKWIPEKTDSGIPKVGTRIKIIDAKWGAIGANGLCGVVTDKLSDGGVLKTDPGYNVDTGRYIWRINLDAEIKILN